MPSSSDSPFWQTNQLNNRGCVLIMEGTLFEANNIFEFAVKNFGTIESSRNRIYASIQVALRHFTITPQGYCEEDEEKLTGSMTKNSQLRASSYCGQVNQDKYHQVYSLPLVMHDDEWAASSLQEKYNILIFNTSLCNHLLGMYLLKQETIYASSSSNTNYSIQGYQYFFEVAGMLYKSALSNISTLNPSGIDQLCHVAMFNNISHVYKTLQGCDSREAYNYDILLLKAIYWWKDSNSNLNGSSSTNMMNMSPPIYGSSSLRNDSTATVTESMMTTSVTSATEESIDSFLDNIFYLISASDTPASAA
ncbi:hypothetical protein FRACYDRAFT_236380 [Fragilariopsis cylindrus CCMP1102]|uniref:Uncharacterized protein n=1 Tax=Fragilariopsis cylindrus CCMP1102 TaxID=635003 RepID=A0A1E7FQC8_9STRA|nr:hypothetical protein FRACYDRAFT_236380 [Fragilariopsis cylindrus CCMP1102]|eukprot:OEU20305.1 hypothetical protein FRACYDRAFT_236380 [Fragilariopsis cylindrus CCMP1102]